MRFELSIALKYLIPRFKQPSVAIISMVSTLVVAMVVWLVLVFLSVTEGLEKKWVNELISINAPLRITPTDAYYQSYYYQIDSLSAEGGYTTKSIGEKLLSNQTDPYDPSFDSALPVNFPVPDKDETGSIRDLVKELHSVIDPLAKEHRGLKASEYEVSFGTLQFNVTQESDDSPHKEQSFISQLSYIASHNLADSNLSNMIVPPTAEDYYHILKSSLIHATSPETTASHFFEHAKVTKLKPSNQGYILPETLYPEEGSSLNALAFYSNGAVYKISIPANEKERILLEKESSERGRSFFKGKVVFSKEAADFVTDEGKRFSTLTLPLVLENGVLFNSELEKESIHTAKEVADLRFTIEGQVQTLPIKGSIFLEDLFFAEVSPLSSDHPNSSFWVCKGDNCIPSSSQGQGVIISKNFKGNGVHLGDKGTIAYTTSTLSSIQEQKLPIYVAGFYDPGLFPMGNKIIFAESSLVAQLRSNLTLADGMLGNGIHLWLNQSNQADIVKAKLQKSLTEKGIDRYWTIESFKDYEFAKPILTQLKSDKNLFTLIAIIILVVACSNIISMLILLVNDKKREIAIMQAMGASSIRIGFIFGICGFVIGFISSIIGIVLSLVTLKHLQSLVDFLSFLQGHDAFQAAFYGSQLPNELSISALLFVLIATTAISLIAALVPAIKASKIRPSQMLRSEG